MHFDSAFIEIAEVLLIATAIGVIGMWLRQPLIVTFIVAGIFLGPAGVGLVTEYEQVELLASFGISLLLFVVGLKLDTSMIRAVGPVALATGAGQIVFTTLLGVPIALQLGLELVPALYVSVALTFASTIIVVKLLSDKREIDALHGRIAVGLLIVQDLAVILVMIGLTALGPGGEVGGEPAAPGLVALKGLALLGALAALARWVLPWVAARIAGLPELLVLFGIAWAIAVAAAAEVLGFNKEVGAFLAGVSLASTPYRDSLSGRLVTVRDFLLLFFFVDLGARLDLSLLGSTIGPALVFSGFVIVGHPIIVISIMGIMGYRKRTSFLTGLTVAQISEFSLILGSLGLGLGYIDAEAMGLITSVALITIALSTYLILNSSSLYERLAPVLGVFERRLPYREIEVDSPAAVGADVILFGLGRYGGGIARHLRLRNRRVIGVDFDPQALRRWRGDGLPVLYGDVADPELFEHLPLTGVKWVISTAPELDTSRVLLRHLKERGYKGKVAVACRDAEEAAVLHVEGADLLLRPFADAAEQAVDAVTSGMDQLSAMELSAVGLVEIRLAPGSPLAGRTVADTALGERFGVTLLAVGRSGRTFFNPRADFQLFPGDRLILSGESGSLTAASAHLGRVEFPDRPEGERDFNVEEVPVDTAAVWHDRTIADLDVRNRFGVTIVAVKSGERMSAPSPSYPLQPGDRLVVAGSSQAIDRLRQAAASPTQG
jgi:Kef-type K+ transport system membrane component KefB/Trk K+ transport system NAD-binding subunit